jgi:hypothetical protein
MKRATVLGALLTVILIVGLAGPVMASSIFGAQPWGEFSFPGAVGPAASCTTCTPSSGGNSFFLGGPPWTLSTLSPVNLLVTDAFISVDRFEIFDSNVSLGTTSSPTNGGNCGSDPVICFGDPLYSHGVFGLAAGDHSITISQIEGISGAAFLCVEWEGGCGVNLSPVPEPTTLLLLGSSLVGVIGMARRRLGG